MGRVLRQARRASRRGCVDLGAAVIHMPREEIDFKDPRPSSRELGIEFVGRRLFGDDWIGKLSIADLKLLEQYGPKIEFRNGVEVRTINPCPERIRNRLDRAFGRYWRICLQQDTAYDWLKAHVPARAYDQRAKLEAALARFNPEPDARHGRGRRSSVRRRVKSVQPLRTGSSRPRG
jgi:hypothetical protein